MTNVKAEYRLNTLHEIRPIQNHKHDYPPNTFAFEAQSQFHHNVFQILTFKLLLKNKTSQNDYLSSQDELFAVPPKFAISALVSIF